MPANESMPTLSSWLLFQPGREFRPERALQPEREAQDSPPPCGRQCEAVVERLRDVAPYAALLALPGHSP